MESGRAVPGKRAIVTKSSKDRTFSKGDHIIFYEDGTIGCVEAGGWIDLESVEEAREGMEFVVDTEYYQARIQQAKRAQEDAERVISGKR